MPTKRTPKPKAAPATEPEVKEPETPPEEPTATEQEADRNAAEARQARKEQKKNVEAFVVAFAPLLHPTAVASSYLVIDADRHLLRDLLNEALAAGWTLNPPQDGDDD